MRPIVPALVLSLLIPLLLGAESGRPRPPELKRFHLTNDDRPLTPLVAWAKGWDRSAP